MNTRFKVVLAIVLVIGLMYAERYYSFDSTETNTPAYAEEEQSISEENAPNEEILGGICDQCGKQFTGRGYTEVSDGVWQETKSPYQSFICSRECGLKHTGKWHSILGEKNDGKVYDKEPCSLCEGTGVEKNHSSMSSEYGRVCPQCDGKGYQSY